MERIGEEFSERYHYEPPKVWVERHVRPKWGCSRCHQGVHIAPCPPHILPKSNASISLLAYLIISKFVDGMPLYRVCQQLARQEVRLSPGTVGTWVNEVGEAVLPLINLLHEELLSAPFVQMDETYLQVLKSEKAPASEHYMVVRAAGPPGRRIILFNYEPSRTVAALQNLLMGPAGPYTGKLLTDGLELYDTVAEALRLTHLGCLQHCRTYYHKAAKVTELPSGRNLARVAIEDYIGRVYAVERQIKELREERERAGSTLPLEAVLKIRQERSAPLMAAFKEWVDKLLPGVPPASALGKALSYTVNQGRSWPCTWSIPKCPQTIITWKIRSGRLHKGAAHGYSPTIPTAPRQARICTLWSAALESTGLSPTHIWSICSRSFRRPALPMPWKRCSPGTPSLFCRLAVRRESAWPTPGSSTFDII